MESRKYFYEADSVWNKIRNFGKSSKALEPKAYLAILTAEKYVNGAILQWDRIQETKKLLPGQGLGVDVNLMQKLFLDIHFYFICCDKVQNLLKHLAEMNIDPRFTKLWGSIKGQFKPFNDARNHLEHVDTRFSQKYLQDFGNLYDNTYTFGGDKFDLSASSLKTVTSAYSQIISILQIEK